MTTSRPNIERIGAALASPARVQMAIALMDGRYWTATELAHVAGVGRSSATDHLALLLDVGLIVERRQGRHRYIALASDECAHLIELMGVMAPEQVGAATTYRAQRADEELRTGRTCYRHLAGALGVELLNTWRLSGFVTDDWNLTPTAHEWAEALGLILTDGRQRLIRPCLDWTERRDHAAGAFPDAFCAWAFDQRFIERGSHPRAAVLTDTGREFFASMGPPKFADRPRG